MIFAPNVLIKTKDYRNYKMKFCFGSEKIWKALPWQFWEAQNIWDKLKLFR